MAPPCSIGEDAGMGAIEICLVGLAVVIVSILLLRLHAFLGLAFGSLCGVGADSRSGDGGDEPSGGRIWGRLSQNRNSHRAGGDHWTVPFGEWGGGADCAGAAFALRGEASALGLPWERILSRDSGLFRHRVLSHASAGAGSFARTNPKVYLLALLSVVAGASMAHSLVPPTPGPLLVAARLEVSLGVLIPAGLLLGLVTISVGYAYAHWANGRFEITYREGDLPTVESETERALPGLGWSLLPILLPLVLISVGTFREGAGRAAGLVGDLE